MPAAPSHWYWTAIKRHPTGRRRHRVGKNGVLILQIEETATEAHVLDGDRTRETHPYWRDAVATDLTVEEVAR